MITDDLVERLWMAKSRDEIRRELHNLVRIVQLEDPDRERRMAVYAATYLSERRS